MSNDQYRKGQNDARQSNGPQNTHGMHHQDANKYNAGFRQGQNGNGKK